MNMIRFAWWACLFLLCINTAFAQPPKKVVMFGNSITYGGAWDQLLQRNDVLNWGLPGQTTGQLCWNVKDIFRLHPGTRIWFIEGGINDITLGVPVSRIVANQKEVVDSLHRHQITPVIQSTLYVVGDRKKNRKVKQVNKQMRRWCSRQSVDYLDLNQWLSRKGELIGEISTDGCHLKPEGYLPWATAVKALLADKGIE